MTGIDGTSKQRFVNPEWSPKKRDSRGVYIRVLTSESLWGPRIMSAMFRATRGCLHWFEEGPSGSSRHNSLDVYTAHDMIIRHE